MKKADAKPSSLLLSNNFRLTIVFGGTPSVVLRTRYWILSSVCSDGGDGGNG